MCDRRLGQVIWVLRVAVALEFFGHGWLALGVKPNWLPYITLFGIAPEVAPSVMLAVGALDIVLALHVLVRPYAPLLAWMALWGFFTATLRPLTGEPFLEFIERGANWGAPLALLLLLKSRKQPLNGEDCAVPREAPRGRRVCRP